jgi:hypothetical protein
LAVAGEAVVGDTEDGGRGGEEKTVLEIGINEEEGLRVVGVTKCMSSMPVE